MPQRRRRHRQDVIEAGLTDATIPGGVGRQHRSAWLGNGQCHRPGIGTLNASDSILIDFLDIPDSDDDAGIPIISKHVCRRLPASRNNGYRWRWIGEHL